MGDVLRTYADARVLVVDDQADNALLLRRLLQRHGLDDVTTVTDPRVVMTGLSDLDPDLVLLDLQMPYVDGHQVLSHLRQWSGATYLPVIVLTADVSPEALRRAMDGGATDFLTKPFNATEILIRVRNLLETRYLHQFLAESGLVPDRR
jgi:PleD family two-component response regulator